MIDNTVEEIKVHVEAIMRILNIPITESNRNTPLRIAKMFANELFRNRNDFHIDELKSQMKVFPNEGTSTPVKMKRIKFNSMCEHHWLPFMGFAEVTYIPRDTIIGLSKIPRVIKFFSQKPQLQERLTNEIGEFLFALLNPKYLRVEMTATHTCVMCRGAESECSTITLFEREG